MPPGRVLLTGASGLVGRALQARLLAAGWQVVAVARRPAKEPVPAGVIRVAADLAGERWQQWCEGCTAAINLAGIASEDAAAGATFDRVHRVAVERLLAACRAHGITRIVHVSAAGAAPDAASPWLRSKAAGEALVRESPLAWTVLRPTVIFGPGDRFVTRLARRLAQGGPFIVFGDGALRVQPVAAEDVAEAVLCALDSPAAERTSFDLGGPEAMAYDELVRRTAAALGVTRSITHLPLTLPRAVLGVAERLTRPHLPLSQLAEVAASATCDIARVSLALGVPRVRYAGPTWLSA